MLSCTHLATLGQRSLRRFSEKSIVILNPRKSGILPRKRPAVEIRTAPGHLIRKAIEQEVTERQQELVSSPSKRSESILESVNSLKPRTKSVSSPRYKTLAQELTKSYTKSQLRQVLVDSGVKCSKSLKKDNYASKILSELWGLKEVRNFDLDGLTLVENTIELSERDFILALGSNGAMIREWAKSGAKISVAPEKRQLVIQASQSTFNWILASLHHMENSLCVSEIPIGKLEAISPIPEHVLRWVQRLSDTYFAASPGSQSIIVYSRNKETADLAQRLLVQNLPDPPAATSSEYLYDINPENLCKYHLSEVDNEDAIPWSSRLDRWFRWEAVKTRSPSRLDDYHFQALMPSTFQTGVESGAGEQQMSIDGKILSYIENSPQPPVLTATLGLLLHASSGEDLLPHSGMKRLFDTSIPLVNKMAGSLASYGLDVEQELPEPQKPSTDTFLDIVSKKTQELSDTEEDGWKDVFSPKGEVFTLKKKETYLKVVSKMLQVKLVPSPVACGDDCGIYSEYPSVEIWCDLSHHTVPKLQLATANVVQVPYERNIYVSVPDKIADLRFSVTSTRRIPLADSLKRFLSECSISSENAITVPRGITLEIDGRELPFIYHSATVQTQTELAYRGDLLQLALIDGGPLGGRRVEANLVAEDNTNATAFVEKALNLLEDVGNTSITKLPLQ